MREDDFFTTISDRYTSLLLLAIQEYDRPVILKELQHITNHTQTLRSRLGEMEDDGLVIIKIMKEPRKVVSITLTPLGREIAVLLSIVDSLVRFDGDGSIGMKYADPIIRLLRGHEYLMQTEILKIIPIYRNVVKVLDALEKDRLITIEVSKEKKKNLRYSLTDTGKRIADVFQLINEKIIQAKFQQYGAINSRN